MPAIVANYPELVSFDENLAPYNGPALFINGDFSTKAMQKDGLLPDDVQPVIKAKFPDATIVIIEQAGHFVHTDKPVQVSQLIGSFLDAID